MSVGSHFYKGDTSEIRSDIAELVLKYGSLSKVAKEAHCSVSYLHTVMRCGCEPGRPLLDWLGFDREITVKYIRR